MGKRRYYCDYCDRSFIDDIAARKKHLNGVSHLRNRSLHYARFRDLRTFIEEESKKEECFKFLKTGFCSFGENCFRSHFTRQQLHALESQANEEDNFHTYCHISKMGNVDSWLRTRNEIFFLNGTAEAMTAVSNFMPLVQRLDTDQFMPPSLRRVCPDDISDARVEHWG